MDPECRTAVENAAKLCADLGHDVEEAAPAVPEDYFTWFLITFLAAVAQEFAFAEETTGVQGPAQRGRGQHVAVPRVGPGLLGCGALRGAGAAAPGQPADRRVLRDL